MTIPSTKVVITNRTSDHAIDADSTSDGEIVDALGTALVEAGIAEDA